MYSLAHVHLLLNHLPIILTALGLLFIVIGVIRRREEMARLAMAVFIGSAVSAVPTYFTGEPAEHAVRRLPGVTRDFIERHSDAALFAAVITGVLGLFALWALWRYRRPTVLPPWVVRLALIGGLFASSAMARTGLLGGEIRHTEIRPESSTATSMDDTLPKTH
jgi:uncharacterized membrane protein